MDPTEHESLGKHSRATAATGAADNRRVFSVCALALAAGVMIATGARSEELAHADTAVLSAVARAFCSAFPRDYLIVRSSAAEPPESFDDPSGRVRLESDVIRSFKERNGPGAMIPADVNFACLRRTDSEKIDEAFGSSPRNDATRPSRGIDWTSFYKVFRGSKGVVRMRLPAYSDAGDQATVYSSYTCGRLCGQGSLFVLKRNDDSWFLIKTISLWIS